MRLLLVEDSRDDADLVIFELNENGFDVACTRVDTATAMRKALADNRWDMVISDFNLPKFGAREALAMLRESDEYIPFVIVSGFIGEENAIALMKEGASDFVMKDKLARLAPVIERELQDAAVRRERKQADRELLASRAQLRELAAYLQTVREEERTRIARELHDELGQMLTAVKLDAMWLSGNLSSKNPGVAEKITAMSALIDETLDAMRRVAADLRPTMLDDLGLVAAVEWLTEEFAKRSGIGIRLERDVGQEKFGCGGSCEKEDCRMDGAVATAAFRIVQECLTNVTRHAEATHVQVYLKCRDGKLMIWVSDDGKGLPADKTKKSGAYGMIGMRERAQSLGGTLEFFSTPGKGVRAEVVIPIRQVEPVKWADPVK